MKKLMLFAVLSIMMGINVAAQTPAKVERQGNTFMPAKQTKQKSEPVGTPYIWKDSKGVSYTIYMSPNTGSCFVIKTSKNGKEYRDYMNKKVSAQICKEMGVEYKLKNK